ncbi:Cyclin-dependent kinase G-2 [Sesamum alatum]|uniref:Cyclin-dependent kinase G-2 n=1 Tax=Sesamum alatum TaxID=300844 RepID=A0AAE1YVK9_9LAMI|nr:Cyclin-dependent kinase G-2 [Sesamum alatum]
MAFAALYSCNENDHRPRFHKVDHSLYDLRSNVILGRADHYMYLNVISQGSYGVVYRAMNRKTGEVVAMKQEIYGLCPSTLREISILKSLPRHPSIVQLKEVVVDACDNVFVVMEHLDTDLQRLMDVKKKQPSLLHPCEVKCMMKQMLEGVRFLHHNGVMHRDLKPANLLVNKNGELRICDFGLSRQFQSESGPYSPGVMTLWYRAPEVLAGVRTYSSAIDMWSVGCIMGEMVLKEVLFKGTCEMEQFRIICMSFGIGCTIPYDNQRIRRFLAGAAAAREDSKLSELGFDLLNKLLQLDPEKRITADEALNHGWFKEYDPYFFWFSKTRQQST